MVTKSKAHVYGKKKRPQEKLERAFANLSLGISSPEKPQTGKQRATLDLQQSKS